MNIAVIPARGGSKRIPYKNIREFCGKPMIAWSIEAAQQSGCFERIIVSTDDEKIAAVALDCGAEVPFVRPKPLANDYAGTIPVIRHAIEWFDQHGIRVENVCCLYATAPFVQVRDIKHGLEILQNQKCDYAFSVCNFAFPIQRAIRITQKMRVEMFQPEHFMTRSQDLEEAYHDAGQFYWGKAHAWQQELSLFGAGSVPVILPRYRVQDIDTPDDWKRAELLFKIIEKC
jgi:N-acylneuraminate cytidylyltransferase